MYPTLATVRINRHGGEAKCSNLSNGEPAFITFPDELKLPCSSSSCPGYYGCEKCCKNVVKPSIGPVYMKVPRFNGTRSPLTTNATASWSHKAGDIYPRVVIGISAGATLLAFIILVFFYWYRRRSKRRRHSHTPGNEGMNMVPHTNAETAETNFIEERPPAGVGISTASEENQTCIPLTATTKELIDEQTQVCLLSHSSFENKTRLDYAGISDQT